MNRITNPVRTKQLVIATAICPLLAGLISGGHYWYGAVIYNRLWRTQVSYWILAFALVAVGVFYVYWKNADNLVGRIALWVLFPGAVVFQTGFTAFECTNSHVLKGVLYSAGMARYTLEQLFPPAAYRLPDNWLFELTGWLQLFGFVAVWYAYQVFKDRPWTHYQSRS